MEPRLKLNFHEGEAIMLYSTLSQQTANGLMYSVVVFLQRYSQFHNHTL